jgi:hypothetical protein
LSRGEVKEEGLGQLLFGMRRRSGDHVENNATKRGCPSGGNAVKMTSSPTPLYQQQEGSVVRIAE